MILYRPYMPGRPPIYAACFEPTSATVAYLAIAATVASAGATIYSAQQAGAASDYNAKIAENNAIAARQAADFQADQQRRRGEKLAGQQRVAYSAAGVSIDDTPLDVIADSATQSELDAQGIKYAGDIQAMNAHSQAALERFQASSARLGGYFGAGSTLLTGAYRAGNAGLLSSPSTSLGDPAALRGAAKGLTTYYGVVN